MIFTAIFDAVSGLVGWIASLLGGIHLPGFANDLVLQLGPIVARINGLGAWFDFTLGVTVAGAVLTVYLACLVVKIVLRIVAFVPVVGGAG